MAHVQKVEWQKVERSKGRITKGRIFLFWEGRKFSNFYKKIREFSEKNSQNCISRLNSAWRSWSTMEWMKRRKEHWLTTRNMNSSWFSQWWKQHWERWQTKTEINVLGLKTWPYETACQNFCMAWIKIMYICKIKISPNK